MFFFKLDPSFGKKLYNETNKVLPLPQDQQDLDCYIFAWSLSCYSFHISKSISFILSFILILIHFIDHSPSHLHLLYLVILILYRISTSLSLSFFSQSRPWKSGISLDKVLI